MDCIMLYRNTLTTLNDNQLTNILYHIQTGSKCFQCVDLFIFLNPCHFNNQSKNLVCFISQTAQFVINQELYSYVIHIVLNRLIQVTMLFFESGNILTKMHKKDIFLQLILIFLLLGKCYNRRHYKKWKFVASNWRQQSGLGFKYLTVGSNVSVTNNQ